MENDITAGVNNTGGIWTDWGGGYNGFSAYNGLGGDGVYLFDDGNAHLETDSIMWISGDALTDTNIGAGGGNVYLVTGGGSVGIGTAVPQVQLDLGGTSLATDILGTEDEFHITRQINGGVSYPQLAAFQLGTYNNSSACCGPQTRLDINLKAAANDTLTGDTNVMTLLSNGNVGIDATSPATQLEIDRPNNTTAVGISFNSPAANSVELYQPTGSDSLRINTQTTGDIVTFTQAGQVGIGTTNPGATFTVGNNTFEVNSSGVITAAAGITSSGSITFSGLTSAGSSSPVVCEKSNKLYYYGGTACTNSSDIRLKRDVVTLSDDVGLGAIMKLRPVRYHWKDVNDDKEHGVQFGLIAQEVENIFPAGGITFIGGADTIDLGGGKTEKLENVKGVNYDRLVVPLIKAVQELKAEFDGDHAEIVKLKADNDKLKAANDNLEARLTKLEAARH
jgi:hypothetical protein